MNFKLKITPRLVLHAVSFTVYCILIFFLLKMTVGGSLPRIQETAPVECVKVTPPATIDRAKMDEIKKIVRPEEHKTLVTDERASQRVHGVNTAISTGIGTSERYDPLESAVQTSAGITENLSGTLNLPIGEANGGHGFWASRSVSGRKNGLRRGGGTDTESAVVKALDYLQRKQNPDGSWGEPGSENQPALTGLAMLAFLGRGETPDSEKYGEPVRKGLKRLVELADMPGLERSGRGFGCAIVTYALAEAAALVPSGELQMAMGKRVKFLIRQQNKFGSFYDNYDNSPASLEKDASGTVRQGIIAGEPRCDLSFAGWNIQALRAAWGNGVEIDGLSEALEKASEAVGEVHAASGGGFSFGINGGKYEADPEVTPVGIYCLQLLDNGAEKKIDQALRWLKKNHGQEQFTPSWHTRQRFPLYVWYYQTLMLHQYQNGNSPLWKSWNRNIKKMFIAEQQPDGSWTLPKRENDEEIKFANQDDYSVYCTAFGALTLEVYYRYNPSAKLDRQRKSQRDIFADINIPGLDLLLTRCRTTMLQSSRLQNKVVDVKLDLFKVGIFNGKPGLPGQNWEKTEFGVYASPDSTVQVRTPHDFPQELAPMQRAVIYLDNLPQSIYGGLRLKTAIGSKEFVPDRARLQNAVKNKESEPEPPRYRALQLIWNKQSLRQQSLVLNHHYLDVLVPNNLIEKNGNILEIRNIGTEPLCFDFLELSSDQEKPAISLQMTEKEDNNNVLHVSQFASFKEPLSVLPGPTKLKTDFTSPLAQIPGQWGYVDVFRTGTEQQEHYLYQAPRDIVEWLWGGGNRILLERNSFMPGEIFVDDLGWPKLSWYGFNRVLRLFDGNPHKIICNIVPADPMTVPYDLFWAAAQNDADTITIQVNSYRFLNADLTVTCPVPWTGLTKVELIKGVAAAQQLARFVNKGVPSRTTERQEVHIKSSAMNIDKITGARSECGLFQLNFAHTGFTTIRLRRQGTTSEPAEKKWTMPKFPPLQFDNKTPLVTMTDWEGNYQRTSLRTVAMMTAIESDSYHISTVPAGKGKIGVAVQVVPWDQQSTQIAIQFARGKTNSPHGARLFFGDVNGGADYFTFWVFPRLSETWRSVVKLRFQLQGGTVKKFYEVTLKTNRWQQVIVPCPEDFSLSWGSVCILGDPEQPEYTMKTPISFEFNGWAQYRRKTSHREQLEPYISRMESRKNYIAVILLGKPGASAFFQHRFADAVMFKTPVVSINQLDESVPGLENPSGNLNYDCIKTKTSIRFDQNSQIARIEATFPLKFAQRWYEKHLDFFTSEEKEKIKQGLLSPLVIQIKSNVPVE